ncbi:MAG: S49 family peptidase [Ancalomicrobiaceae bacterium]|nr:S49 family peptidase [Ancalomicrobiaceae bacterium]
MSVWDWLRQQAKAVLPEGWISDAPVIPVVRLIGPIGMVTPFSASMSLSTVAAPLERAFRIKRAPVVAIVVNSPGGSAVQSRLIHERIRYLADEHEKPVLVFLEDAAASGGYMIACAGDEIFADPSSIVGSIGVLAAGFGFVELIQKLGIERRVYTAGEKKVTLDPFQPEVAEDIEHLKALQLDVHETFIDLVRERRGSRLKPGEDLFTGRFWTGKTGVELGLVDQIGELRSVIKARFGDKAKVKLISPPKSLLPGRGAPVGVSHGASASGASLAGASFAAGLMAEIEARALWSRLGL